MRKAVSGWKFGTEREMQLLQSMGQTSRAKTSPDLNGLAGWLLGLLRGLWSERQPAIKQMHLLETLALGGKRQLMLVSCAGEQFLVGGGLESVETIVRLHGEVSPEITAKKMDRTCL